MTTNRKLETIFEELIFSGEKPSGPALAKWLKRYPEYREEILEFVSEWQLQDSLPHGNTRFDDQAAAVAASVRGGVSPELERRDTAEGFRGVFYQAQSIGLHLEEESGRLGINVQLLDLIDRKRVKVESIPGGFLTALSSGLRVTARRFAQWLGEGTPAFVPSAQLGARSTKSPAPTMSFEEAWKKAGLSPQDLKRWTPARNRNGE